LIIAFRWWLPETNYFQVTKAEREFKHAARQTANGQEVVKAKGMSAFLKTAGAAVRHNWVLLVYMVVLMTGFNSCSHGSQDFYPTYLKDQVGMSPTKTTVVTVVGQIGALIGGTTIGYISTIMGRRLTMMTACLIGGALVPGYVFIRNFNVTAVVFFEQFFVGGVWGPIPIHLIELSPPALRTLIVGLTYQLGNLASSASATIQSTIGEEYPLPPAANGTKRFDYGKVIGIFMGAVWAYMLIFLLIGPEMTQEEREEMAQEAREFEDLRRQGVSLKEIGEQRARAGMDGPAAIEEKTEIDHREHHVSDEEEQSGKGEKAV
jgi:MFS transporter, SHS family, lactate transporter